MSHSHDNPGHACAATVERSGRLDRFVSERVGEAASRQAVKEWIKSGTVTVNGSPVTKPSHGLSAGDEVAWRAPEPTAATPEAEDGSLDILHEDEHLLVINKPAGLTVHPAPDKPTGTLVHRLLGHYPGIARCGGDAERPGIVHRIDQDTSGLLAVALTEEARLGLTRAFAEREVAKEYLALVRGAPQEPTGVMDGAIGRHPSVKTKMAVVDKGGRPALSEYRTLWADAEGRAALLAVAIHTGRTHQIRVHLAHLGYPIVGDATYGGRTHLPEAATRWARRQLLHAWRLAFDHPVSGERLAFTLPPPADLPRCLIHLARRCQRVVVTGLPGSGKTSFTERLRDAGVPVFSADACVAGLYAPGGDGHDLLLRRYGERFVPDAARAVDKAALLAAMRQEEPLRREVMDMVHPLVRHRMEAFWAERAGARVCVAEVPLYVEAGWRDEDVVLVGVHCRTELRHARLAARGWDADLIAQMDSWQWPEDKKLAACDLVADNNGDLTRLDAEAARVRHALRDLRRRRVQAHWAHWSRLWSAPS